MFPATAEERVLLPRPLTRETLADACRRCGFSEPVASLDGRRFHTRSRPSLLSLGEEIELELVTPVELAIRSTSVQITPILPWAGGGSVRKLVHALGAVPAGLRSFG